LRLQENCRIGDDNDVQNCVTIINTLTEVLLKHKLKQFPEQMRGLVAHKLINKGIIDSFTNNYQISFDDNHFDHNSGEEMIDFFGETNDGNPEAVQPSDNQYSEEIPKASISNHIKEVETDIKEVETVIKEVENDIKEVEAEIKIIENGPKVVESDTKVVETNNEVEAELSLKENDDRDFSNQLSDDNSTEIETNSSDSELDSPD